MKVNALKRAVVRTGITSSLVLSATAIATGVVFSPAAQAQVVTSGSLGFVSPAGDWVGGGATSTYSTANGDTLTVTGSTDEHYVNVSVSGALGDWWYLDLMAPSSGPALAPGTYTGATRYPFNTAAQPGLSFVGDGRGCNTVAGSFTITQITWGPYGYIQELDGSFSQQCEGFMPALVGQVQITNPAPPAVLTVKPAVASDGTASTLNGSATVHGTVACDKTAQVTVSGKVTQVSSNHKTIVNGTYTTTVNCKAGAPVAWSASATPSGSVPFRSGDAQVDAQFVAQDPDYAANTVTVDQTNAVSLHKG